MDKGSLAAALIAFGFLSFLPRQRAMPQPGPRYWLERDLPALGLFGGRSYRVDPDALLYLGDPVAVRLDEATVVLAPYHDELLPSVIGRIQC